MLLEIILATVSGGFAVSIIEIIISRRKRRIETKQSEYASQQAGLDLVKQYKELVEETLSQQLERIGSDVTSLKADIKYINTEIKNISNYLNGGYRDYKKKL